jgi:A/G-specific adenine glycosylase
VRQALTTWFAEHRRALPWRPVGVGSGGVRGKGARRDPYAVLVSEVMLQQTRVDTVVPYFERWMRRFPDVHSLACADEDEVLKLWQGLGYYRRALRLLAAAREVTQRHDGAFPDTRAGLEALPGVGAYTGAAIASLAFGHDEIAVDGNVRRVAARVLAWDALPADREIERVLAERLADAPAAGAEPPLAEALIELGALVCTPRAPRCGACPLRTGCGAATRGTPEAFPATRARVAPPRIRRYALVALEGDRLWLRRRSHTEMLSGLWGFPQSASAPEGGRPLRPVVHAYSHFRLELVPVLVEPRHPELDRARDAAPRRIGDLADLALSGVDLRVLERLREAALLPGAALS